jgi:uncharacterized oligopeptide transporter (OPT) family protein
VSHEEPDIPDDDAPAATAGPHVELAIPPPPVLRGTITVKTIVAGILVAAVMGLAYPYMVLKLGFGPNVSVVAAFFGFGFLSLFDLFTRKDKRTYSRWQNNLVEAAGTSAAQTAFMCVLLGGFDILRHDHPDVFHLQLSPFTSFLWLTAACSLGVLLAVPLRRHFIVDEKLPFVDGLSTAETLTVMDPPKDASADVRRMAFAAAKAVLFGVITSGLLMLVKSDTGLITGGLPDSWMAPWSFSITPRSMVEMGTAISVPLAATGVGVQYSLLSIGSGMIVGTRINVSMLLGGVLAWIVAPPLLVYFDQLHPGPDSLKLKVLSWVMWPATGMLVAGGLTALALRWRLMIDTFKNLRHVKIDSGELPLSFVITGVAISAVALCVIQSVMLGMPVWMTVTAIIFSVPLMLVGLRVLGETNWGPISALSNMMQGVFATVAPGNIAVNMVASGTTGTIATSSEAIMQDYKCGELIGTRPRTLTIMQLIAVPVGAAAVSIAYPVLVHAFGIIDTVDKKAQLTSPISQKWARFAALLKDGLGALPTSAVIALLVFSLLGVLFTVLEAKPRLRKYVPSPTGVGIGILVPFNVVFTMFLGGLAGMLWEQRDKKSADTYMVPLASGWIAGEALVAVVAAIVLAITAP